MESAVGGTGRRVGGSVTPSGTGVNDRTAVALGAPMGVPAGPAVCATAGVPVLLVGVVPAVPGVPAAGVPSSVTTWVGGSVSVASVGSMVGTLVKTGVVTGGSGGWGASVGRGLPVGAMDGGMRVAGVSPSS